MTSEKMTRLELDESLQAAENIMAKPSLPKTRVAAYVCNILDNFVSVDLNTMPFSGEQFLSSESLRLTFTLALVVRALQTWSVEQVSSKVLAEIDLSRDDLVAALILRGADEAHAASWAGDFVAKAHEVACEILLRLIPEK